MEVKIVRKYKVNQEKWRKMSLAEQMANIGSEVNRAIFWQEQNNKKLKEECAFRAIEMLDLTSWDARWKDKAREPMRLKEVLVDYFFELGNFEHNAKALKDYFLPFALLANKNVHGN